MEVLCLLLLVVGEVQASTLYQWIVDSQTSFNYDPNPTNMLGVYNWPRTYSEDCGGIHQSPVDIKTDLVRYGVSCQCPRMIYRSNILRGSFKNNGHSAEFEPEREEMLQLTDIPYTDGTYKMHDFHLHYGGVTGRDFELQGLRFRGSGIMSAGSEHTIDGLRFEGELHFVFYNAKYKDLEEADNKTDGVVVISILIQKLQGSLTDSTETSRFSDFLERNIPNISPYQANSSTEVDLSIFFNRDCEFYTYAGSTTTPTCHESVRWIILKDPIMVTERAWFMLTGLQSRGDFNSRFGNYRTTQPLNDRVIEANFNRPNGVVLPSPNGEAMMLMMMEMMNMTMEMMNGQSGLQGFPAVPMMMLDRAASSPVGNVRDMPLMMMTMMNMMRNGNIPNLNGNFRSRAPIPMMLQNSPDPNLNGNSERPPMSMMPMQPERNIQSPRVPSPMQFGTHLKDLSSIDISGNNKMMKDNRQQQQRSMMVPIRREQTPSGMPQNNVFMERMMSQLNSPSIPNLIQTSSDMMPRSFQMQPGIMFPDMLPVQADMMMGLMQQDMRMMQALPIVGSRNSNIPNLNGNVRGSNILRMRGRPVFNSDVVQMSSRGIGRDRQTGIFDRPMALSQLGLDVSPGTRRRQ